MSEHRINTLFELLNEYKVEVPVIQRDYAQGRQDEHTKMVRDTLLLDIRSAILKETKPLDLNFVYGKAEDGKFIPIDGQQRLTTLYLLHMYAFSDDDSKTDLLRKFTYKTRTSSRVFFEKLTQNRTTVFSSELIPSKEIEDSEWFVSAWKFDPTVLSALTMLDDINTVFKNVENLDLYLSNREFEPVVFKFLDMDDLGMEDSLYIKLNARGKPLTPFENFKARLFGRLQKLDTNYARNFEQNFDREWTDLFWSKNWEIFDQTYLAFFGVLLMNADLSNNAKNWSNSIDYDKIEERLFRTTLYTLDYLSKHTDDKTTQQLIFNALTDRSSYQDRVLFHAVTTYMLLSEGIDTGSLKQWIRIVRNLTLNSQIDQASAYRRAIESVEQLSAYWEDLALHISKNIKITGFSQEQVEEERIKAQLIIHADFAEEIYKAEKHPYFNGQIRSALWFSRNSKGKYDKDAFVHYWEKISALFDKTKPKNDNLLRRALLTLGDYTLPVSEYKTFCVDDPNEAASTPSMKKLFSSHGDIVKELLNSVDVGQDIGMQLENIINNGSLPKSDWRYCFVKFPDLFRWMSIQHLRLRRVGNELLIISNKSSNGRNYEVFTVALYYALKANNIDSYFVSELGTYAERYLQVKEFTIRYLGGKYIFKDAANDVVYETSTADPIYEATKYLL